MSESSQQEIETEVQSSQVERTSSEPEEHEKPERKAEQDDTASAIRSFVEEIESLREKIKAADGEIEERALALKHSKKMREQLQVQLDSLLDEGWETTRLPLAGDVRQPKPLDAPQSLIPSSLDVRIEDSGLDTDLRVAIETVQQDYQIKTLADLNQWLGTMPATLRAAYLNAGQESAIVAKIIEVKSAATTEDDSWKAVSIDELQLPGKLPEYLREAGIETIGQLAEHTSSGKWLTDIPNVGKGKSQVIEDAMDRFWASRKQPA